VTTSQARDPFSTFGIPHAINLDIRALERRYLQLSRECHPDHNRSKGAADCGAVLQRAADINDAYRVLKDRWRRAQALIELRAPEAMARQKDLDLAEEVASIGDDPERIQRLAERLARAEDSAFIGVERAVNAGDWQTAARHLHQSKYVRKARNDLDQRLEASL
jgi:Fe-S protein assembly co-chaperone HscB